MGRCFTRGSWENADLLGVFRVSLVTLGDMVDGSLDQPKPVICMLVHTCDACTYAPSGSMGTLGRPLPGLEHTETVRGNTKARGTEPSRGCRCAQTLSRDTKEQRSAQPCGLGYRPGPTCAPRRPRSHAPRVRRAATKRTQNLAAGDLRVAGREPSRRLSSAPASASHRFPAVRRKLEGGASARPAVPLSARPGRPGRGGHTPH